MVPVDGVFTAWGNWSACSLTCGNGTQSRNRSCEGPYFGGKNCTGDWGQTKDCNTFPCPGKYISNLFFFFSVNDLDTPLIHVGRILIHVIFIFTFHFSRWVLVKLVKLVRLLKIVRTRLYVSHTSLRGSKIRGLRMCWRFQ